MICADTKVNGNDFYVVNKDVDIVQVKLELTELILMVDSVLQLIAEELHSVVRCSTKLWFVQAWVNYSKITYQLYEQAYGDIKNQVMPSMLLSVNPNLNKDVLRNSAIAHIYQLQSFCHLAAHVIFITNIDTHLQNSLIIIDGYMQMAVNLIDLLLLDEYKSPNIDKVLETKN